MESLLSAFNDANVPKTPKYKGLYSMTLNVPVKVTGIEMYTTSRGECLKCIYEDEACVL